ncbi:hypothetical protein HK405_011966, partial [Cladochytrium tenue]
MLCTYTPMRKRGPKRGNRELLLERLAKVEAFVARDSATAAAAAWTGGSGAGDGVTAVATAEDVSDAGPTRKAKRPLGADAPATFSSDFSVAASTSTSSFGGNPSSSSIFRLEELLRRASVNESPSTTLPAQKLPPTAGARDIAAAGLSPFLGFGVEQLVPELLPDESVGFANSSINLVSPSGQPDWSFLGLMMGDPAGGSSGPAATAAMMSAAQPVLDFVPLPDLLTLPMDLDAPDAQAPWWAAAGSFEGGPVPPSNEPPRFPHPVSADELARRDAARAFSAVAASAAPAAAPALTRRLARLFLARAQARTLAVFHEPSLLADLEPTNRLPGFLLDAVCAAGALSLPPGDVATAGDEAGAWNDPELASDVEAFGRQVAGVADMMVREVVGDENGSDGPNAGCVTGGVDGLEGVGWGFKWTPRARVAAYFLGCASRKLMDFVATSLDVSSLAVVQTLVVMTAILPTAASPALSAFSACLSPAAYAVRMSYYLKLDREHPNRILNPLHLGFAVRESLTPPQLESRRRAWRCIVMVDAYAALLSGFPLGVDESACAFMLDCDADDFPGADSGDELGAADENADASVTDTADDRRSREATGARAWRELLEADSVARHRRPSDWTFVYQACHLLRHAWRISRQLRIRGASLVGMADGRGSGAAGREDAAARAALLRGLGRSGGGSSGVGFLFNGHSPIAASAAADQAADVADARALHNAVLAWLALLPPRLRGFADL